ncbi:uncharacterized protein LOC111707664 [Eurytemora carolleeae]|uniref:uncharacterized protein LOC111707664 n=1 Tax=Eurytemora carolleeae TaxID=1294199 RepID=UPI000C77D48B|nr:uncharacterized protein LOC111707664 [Eurytemora carolleeae]|eukprot:XP_023336570.1 uncharacterized protein LOC111707664 [Eurytemora affinis]
MEYWSWECVILVVSEMILALVGIVLNLIVVSTVRNQESLQAHMHTLLIGNIAFSNLLVSFLAKPISAIYLSYAFSIREWQVGLAFCTLYTLTYHTTWVVIPLSILTLSWLGISSLFTKAQCLRPESPTSVIIEAEGGHEEKTRRVRIVPTARQKGILVSIWVVSGFYGLMACFPDKMINEELLTTASPTLSSNSVYIQDEVGFSSTLPGSGVSSVLPGTRRPRNPDLSYCPILTFEDNVLTSIQLYLSLYIPALAGPILSFLVLVVLCPFLCVSTFRREPGMDHPAISWTNGPGGPCSCILTPLLSLIYIFSYSTHMLYSDNSDLPIMEKLLLKYQVGFCHIVLFPLLSVFLRADLRAGVKRTMHGKVICAVAMEPDNLHSV